MSWVVWKTARVIKRLQALGMFRGAEMTMHGGKLTPVIKVAYCGRVSRMSLKRAAGIVEAEERMRLDREFAEVRA